MKGLSTQAYQPKRYFLHGGQAINDLGGGSGRDVVFISFFFHEWKFASLQPFCNLFTTLTKQWWSTNLKLTVKSHLDDFGINVWDEFSEFGFHSDHVICNGWCYKRSKLHVKLFYYFTTSETAQFIYHERIPSIVDYQEFKNWSLLKYPYTYFNGIFKKKVRTVE